MVILPLESISFAAPRSKAGYTVCIKDEPFGLLTIVALQQKLGFNHSGDTTMHRALVSAIFAGLVGLAASAHAHPINTPQIIKPETATQVTLQKATETVKVRAPRELAATVTKERDLPAESAWGKYGTLLATLVVMCAIALRRQRLGRS